MVNLNKFRAAMAENGLNQKELAKRIGISENSLCSKINGKSRLYADEILSICDVLHINEAAKKAEIFLV